VPPNQLLNKRFPNPRQPVLSAVINYARHIIHPPVLNYMTSYDVGEQVVGCPSSKYRITVTVAAPTGSNTNEPPVPGAAGYALRLSGSDAHADLGAAEAALGLDGTGFAFGAWIRTNSDPADSGAVLLSAGPYVIRWSKAGAYTRPLFGST